MYMEARGPRGVEHFAFYRFLHRHIGAKYNIQTCVIGEINDNYYYIIIRTRRRFVYSGPLCEFTDICEDFNDSENRNELTVVLTRNPNDYLFDLYAIGRRPKCRLGEMQFNPDTCATTT